MERQLTNTDYINAASAECKFKCSVCHSTFRTRTSLKGHEKLHTQHQRLFQCSLCPKAFMDNHRLKLHMCIHSDDKPYACNICSFRSNQASNLKTHMQTHEVSQFKCDYCNKLFTRKASLLTHTNNKHLDKRKFFMCPMCNKNYFCSKALKKHIKVHTGEDIEEECPICHKKYRYLKDHMIMHDTEKTFECSVCHPSFKRAPGLKIHMRVHTGEKPYGCKFCPKRLRQHSHLMSHLKTHTSEKWHECSVCKQSFSWDKQLKHHMRKHEGTQERKYSCTECSKKFLTISHLRNHAATHLDPEEKFECKECGAKFAHNGSLSAHMKKHTDIRITCVFCDRKFYKKQMYNAHFKIHTDEKGFFCKTCNKEFKCPKSGKKHAAKCNRIK